MNIETYGEWLRRQGHQVIKTESGYWYEAWPHVFQAFPYDRLIEPSYRESRQLMLRHGILSLRYSTPLAAPIGKISYHVTLSNPYNLELLRCQARNAVHRGLANCNVEPISFERLAEEGWNLQRDTLDRQCRLGTMTELTWKRICLSAVGLPGFEAWAAVINGDLAASLIIARIDNKYFVPYALSQTKYLERYVNNALFFSVSCELLAREGINSIFFTVQSLDAPKSVDEFKFRMGLKARAVRQRVVFHPLVQPFINSSTHNLVNTMLIRYPQKGFFAKAEGMMRFYLQGKLPLEQQEWPDCLAKCRSKTSELLVSATKPQNVLSSDNKISSVEK